MLDTLFCQDAPGSIPELSKTSERWDWLGYSRVRVEYERGVGHGIFWS